MVRAAGVVLAAGPGQRLKLSTPKLLLPIGGRPMLAWVLDLVEGLPLAKRVLVVGAYYEQILTALFSLVVPSMHNAWEMQTSRDAAGKDWLLVYNPDWPEGLGSSLRRAAEVVEEGMLVFLGDMPFVPLAAAQAVLARAGDWPVAPSFSGQRGFPVYLPASLRPKFLELTGDIGARYLIPDCELIPWDDPGVIQDVDEIKDLGGVRCEV